MTMMESLEAHLLTPPDGLETAEPDETDPDGGTPRFVIDTPEKASWALRKLAAERALIDAAAAVRDVEFAKIQAWYEDVTAASARSARNFEMMLLGYGETLTAADPKLRTISTPGGKLKLTVTQSVHPIGENDKAFIEWARSNGHDELVNVTEKAKIAELRKVLQNDDGTLVPILDTGEPVPVIEISKNRTWKYEPTKAATSE